MFKRKIYNSLLEWKNTSKGKSALLIEGARRIGKSTIAEFFGTNEFPAYKLIDFSIYGESFKDIFANLSNIDDFFSELFLKLGISKLPEGSLIIFDEVQFFPIARQAIKHLVKDGRYYYLETGSLVSIKENTENILIPSEEESIAMYPMDYEEFLWAVGLEYEASELRKSYENRKPLSLSAHQTLIKHFRTYLAVGGMPQAVDTYINTKDFYQVDKSKKNIIKLYEEDLRKIDNKYGTICYNVWSRMPSMLSTQSSRFVVSSLDTRSDSILFTNTLDKLIESKMVLPIYKCNDPTGGFKLTKNNEYFKLYFLDVGIFTSIIYPNNIVDSQDVYQRLILDKLSTNLGMLFENAVAQCLYSSGFDPYYYFWYEDKTKYEIDFLVFNKGKVIPFEVKSNKTSSKKSIEEFKNKYSKVIGERYFIKSKPSKYEDNTTILPFYMLFCFK